MQFERDLFKKQMMNGVDLLEEGQGISEFRVFKKKGICLKMWEWL